MLFSDCTKEVIVLCSTTLSTNNQSETIDPIFPMHPKLRCGRIKPRNETIVRKWWQIESG